MGAALAKAGQGAIAVALGGERIKLRLLRLKDPGAMADAMPAAPPAVQRLDVSVLHALVLERIFEITPEQIKAGRGIRYPLNPLEDALQGGPGPASGPLPINSPALCQVEAAPHASALV